MHNHRIGLPSQLGMPQKLLGYLGRSTGQIPFVLAYSLGLWIAQGSFGANLTGGFGHQVDLDPLRSLASKTSLGLDFWVLIPCYEYCTRPARIFWKNSCRIGEEILWHSTLGSAVYTLNSDELRHTRAEGK